MNTRIALATIQRGNSSVAEYYAKMKSLGDDMEAAGRPLEDEEMVEYIITSLGENFSSLVSALCARAEPISMSELYSQLLNFESRMNLIHGNQSGSANSASRGQAMSRGRGGSHGRGNGRGSSGGRGAPNPAGRGNNKQRQQANNQGGGSRGSYNSNSRGYPNSYEERCQVCFKKNHTAAECWHRYDENYVPDQCLVAAATGSYGVDTNW